MVASFQSAGVDPFAWFKQAGLNSRPVLLIPARLHFLKNFSQPRDYLKLTVKGPSILRPRAARIAQAAQSIDDPVLRLRFLRTAVRPSRLALRLRRRSTWTGLLLALPIPFLVGDVGRKLQPVEIAPLPPPSLPGDSPEPVPVWLVEHTTDSEVYSNGLRIDTRFTVSNRARAYTAFPRSALSRHSGVRRNEPAGIVYHTTESCQAPFEAQQTPVLKRLGESLLEYVRRKRAYHYLIDRFGRVYRVVAESDSADHAGYSVWADSQWFYLNLNESFLGVSFEAQSQAPAKDEIANPAQIRSAAMLTEMLRSRYRIPAENCVTHAQVSVNPSNMLVGYHTDWVAGFPFAALGLPDNYRAAPPALWAFGFECDPAWLAAGAHGVALGAKLAEQDVDRGAAAAHLRPAVYRKALRQRYRAWLGETSR